MLHTSKQDLRNFWLQNRLNLSEAKKNDLSFRIQELLLENIPFQKYNSVNIFLPVHEKCEVRTWGIIHYLQEKYPKLQLSAPRIKNIRDRSMEAVGIEKQTLFVKNKWGIEEPDTGPVLRPENLDIVFLPLITFDLKGHRLGYGGGFYDRYLAKCPNALKIGLSYFEPVDVLPEINEFDVPMDRCITPEQVFRF